VTARGIPVDRLLVGPSALEHADGWRAGFQAERPDRIGEDHACAVERDPLVASAVPELSRVVSPPAVIGAVTSVIVNAVKREAVRAFPHVSKELLKGFPFWHKGNASAAPVLPLWHVGVGASQLHGLPSGPRPAVMHPMGYSARSVQLPKVAPAGDGFAISCWSGNVARSGVELRAAIASEAQAIHRSASVWTQYWRAVAYNDNTTVAVPDGDWFAESHGRIMPRVPDKGNIPSEEP